ncbi:MAG: tRNA(Ile)-lysidine synthetase, partial [Gemmatimonadetes bacterium]|nr:tRNA(Ile)-lysidine synthetase [Gemmatimonadota bacterium]
MTPFEARFADTVSRLALAPGVGLVAVSGGPDSLALLHLLVRCRERHALRLVVAHVDHGIHPDSAEVAQAVARTAAKVGLDLVSGELGLGPGTTEGAAREARYAWLFDALDRLGPGVLLTAHHRDDQVETVLMRVLAGSGPAGLAGMAVRGPRLVRPLLGFSRDELRAYLAGLGATAWEDPANRSPVHVRSWLRLEVVPMLKHRIPDLDARVVALARQAGLDRRAWDALLDVLPLECQHEAGGISVASGSLRSYDSALAQGLIAAAGRRAGLSMGDRRCERVLRLVRSGRSGARLDLGGPWVAELDFGRLGIRRRRTSGAWQVVLSPARGDL